MKRVYNLFREAIAAVEKAADARRNHIANLKSGAVQHEAGAGAGHHESRVAVHRCEYMAKHLYSNHLHVPTDLPMSELSKTSDKDGGVPRLGDRVINLFGNAVPFALQGTVIAIHQHTVHVEVSAPNPQPLSRALI